MGPALDPLLSWFRHQRSKGITYVQNSTELKRILMDLDLLKLEVETCTRCPLHKNRTHAVFGAGPYQANLLVVGEAPGRNEDLEGRPFCGRSGELLDRMLNAISIPREKAFITSVVKCRPPNNRAPLSGEIKACLPFLNSQTDAVSPTAILALGEVAARVLVGKRARLKDLRGTVHKKKGRKIVVTYHPSYILRFTGSKQEKTIKKEAWEDLQLLLSLLYK